MQDYLRVMLELFIVSHSYIVYTCRRLIGLFLWLQVIFTGMTLVTEMGELKKLGFHYFSVAICMKVDESCIRIDGFCIQNDVLMQMQDPWNYVDLLNVWLYASERWISRILDPFVLFLSLLSASPHRYVWGSLTWAYLFIISLGIEIPNKFDMSRPEVRFQ